MSDPDAWMSGFRYTSDRPIAELILERDEVFNLAAILYDALDNLVEHVGRHQDSLPGGPLNTPYQRAVMALSEADGFFPGTEEGDDR